MLVQKENPRGYGCFQRPGLGDSRRERDRLQYRLRVPRLSPLKCTIIARYVQEEDRNRVQDPIGPSNLTCLLIGT